MPTSGCWPPRPTSPDWPCSGSAQPPKDGRWPPEQGRPGPSTGTAPRSKARPTPGDQHNRWPPRADPGQSAGGEISQASSPSRISLFDTSHLVSASVDRIVVVTGGSRGIGRAAAARFAADGDDVVITGRDADQLAKAAAEIDARPQRCDATVATDVEALAEAVGDRLYVLVNMAGSNADTYDPLPLDAPLAQVADRWRANLE